LEASNREIPMRQLTLHPGDRVVLAGAFRTPLAKLRQMIQEAGLVLVGQPRLVDAAAVIQGYHPERSPALRALARHAGRLQIPVAGEQALLQQIATIPRRPKQLALEPTILRRHVPIASPFAPSHP
jgi:hypothetical protein